ncbi:MAG: lipid-binding SYLF domain-containing protein, partial [Planctomycetia bacterium]|nr:lipid-binding SYLF domain-containing protein [Planctomycetia bacterium]
MSLLRNCGFLIFTLLLCSHPALSQTKESKTVNDSIIVLNEIMKIPAKGIPTSLFRKAEGIAIFPGMMKGGFIVGVQKGYGALVVKTQEGVWEYPRFATITSGSIGFQAGVQSADVILF